MLSRADNNISSFCWAIELPRWENGWVFMHGRATRPSWSLGFAGQFCAGLLWKINASPYTPATSTFRTAKGSAKDCFSTPTAVGHIKVCSCSDHYLIGNESSMLAMHWQKFRITNARTSSGGFVMSFLLVSAYRFPCWDAELKNLPW